MLGLRCSSCGNVLLLAQCSCLYPEALQLAIQALNKTALHTPQQTFDFSQQYLHQEELFGLEGRPVSDSSAAPISAGPGPGAAVAAAGATFAGSALQGQRHYGQQWALLKFDQPVTAPEVGRACCVLLFFLMSCDRGTPATWSWSC
jgi:hypothetical protein